MAKNRKGGATKVGSLRAAEAATTVEKDQGGTIEGEPQVQWEIVNVVGGSSSDHDGYNCRIDGCQSKVVAVWKKAGLVDDEDIWPVCEEHQATKFGGCRNDDVAHTATTAATTTTTTTTTTATEGDDVDTLQQSDEMLTTDETKDSGDDADPTALSDPHMEANAGEAEDDKDEEPDALWDLKKIMSISEVMHEFPIKCSHKTCKLPAAAVWVCNDKPTENWYSCLDCQENDFGGWPEDAADIPIQHMTQEHKATLIKKCSKYKEADMPVFPESPQKGERDSVPTNTVTPSFVSDKRVEQQDSMDVVAGEGEPGKVGGAKKSNAAAATNAAPKPSKQQLEIHRKWQAAAEAAGGSDARIVLSKPVAKKIIYDFLYDAFRPMNITEIHTGLKAIVPSPILKACLDDMALDTDSSTQFADDEDEDEEPAKKVAKPKKENPEAVPYKNSLSFKAGKGSNTSLYYVNYNTAKGGDGLDRDSKNLLASNMATADAEESVLKQTLAALRAETEKLLSEPKNEELLGRLDREETELGALTEKLTAARKLKVNEAHKATTKKRIEHYATFWRKRRRLCVDFLFTMEEATDGQINAKKCLAGDGQVDCESDELVAKQAIDYAKSKSNSHGPKKLVSSRTSAISQNGIQPSESFVAVLLDAKGSVERVHFGNKNGEQSP